MRNICSAKSITTNKTRVFTLQILLQRLTLSIMYSELYWQLQETNVTYSSGLQFKEDSNVDLFLCIWISSFGHHWYICSGDNKTERIKEKCKKGESDRSRLVFGS